MIYSQHNADKSAPSCAQRCNSNIHNPNLFSG